MRGGAAAAAHCPLPRRLQQPLPRACGLPSGRTCCSSSSLPLPRSSWALILAAAWTCRAGQRWGGVHGAPPAPAACWWGCAAPRPPASTPPIVAPGRAASPRTHRAGNLDDGQIHVQRGRCRRAGALGGRPARPQQPGQCSAPLLPGCGPDDRKWCSMRCTRLSAGAEGQSQRPGDCRQAALHWPPLGALCALPAQPMFGERPGVLTGLAAELSSLRHRRRPIAAAHRSAAAAPSCSASSCWDQRVGRCFGTSLRPAWQQRQDRSRSQQQCLVGQAAAAAAPSLCAGSLCPWPAQRALKLGQAAALEAGAWSRPASRPTAVGARPCASSCLHATSCKTGGQNGPGRAGAVPQTAAGCLQATP